MFVVLVTYKKPLERVEQYLVAHRAFLDRGYQEQLLIASGPRVPRTGGILLSQCNERAVLETFLSQDPFLLQGIAEYEVIEFTPVKAHPNFQVFVDALQN